MTRKVVYSPRASPITRMSAWPGTTYDRGCDQSASGAAYSSLSLHERTIEILGVYDGGQDHERLLTAESD